MAGGGSAAREWEFSSPGYGDCSITRVGLGPSAYGSGRGSALDALGGGLRTLPECGRRGLGSGSRLLGMRAWGGSIPRPAKEWFPTRSPLS